MITAADPIATNVSAIGATPLAAADDDLIEKEWVDKAKKIVEETKDDPYRREQAVGQLQKDYLKKRYGRELGEA
jgi:Txe/YoeB family toxin of Txe-Axe toxin-antitoxin module